MCLTLGRPSQLNKNKKYLYKKKKLKLNTNSRYWRPTFRSMANSDFPQSYSPLYPFVYTYGAQLCAVVIIVPWCNFARVEQIKTLTRRFVYAILYTNASRRRRRYHQKDNVELKYYKRQTYFCPFFLRPIAFRIVCVRVCVCVYVCVCARALKYINNSMCSESPMPNFKGILYIGNRFLRRHTLHFKNVCTQEFFKENKQK